MEGRCNPPALEIQWKCHHERKCVLQVPASLTPGGIDSSASCSQARDRESDCQSCSTRARSI
eukprot:8770179-Pyramimonas_sp.AAC.1